MEQQECNKSGHKSKNILTLTKSPLPNYQTCYIAWRKQSIATWSDLVWECI